MYIQNQVHTENDTKSCDPDHMYIQVGQSIKKFICSEFKGHKY